MTMPTDDDLLEAIGNGERAALAALMRRHAEPMLALAQRVTGIASDADAIVQDAFLKVWMHAGQWERDGAALFSTWLYRVVLNASIDRRRRPVLEPLGEHGEQSGDPHACDRNGLDQAIMRQRAYLLRTALADVPIRQREVIALYYFSELSGPEAARVLGVSIGSVESLLVRGKLALRAALRRRGVDNLGDLI